MGITVVLAKRSGQSSPLTAGQWNEVMTQIEVAFASVPTASLGTVTQVAMTVPSFLSVAGSPINSSGTFAVTLASQSPNLVFSSPSSGSGTPLFRSLVASDLPTITVAKGGTNLTSLGTAYQLLRTNSGATALEYASITNGSNKVSVTNGVTISVDVVEANLDISAMTGTLGINHGGTGATTAQTARLAILPSITGNAGKYLKVNGGETDLEWAVATSSVASVNSLTGALTITSGTTGTDVAVASVGSTITINIPSASASNRGVITTAAQTIAGQKTFTSAPILPTTDTYIMYSNSGEVTGSAFLAVDATKEQIEVKRSSITERNVALGFNATYHTTNQHVDPETDFILYFDCSSGSLDCTMFDTTNHSAEIGSLYKIVKTTAANNLVIKVQGTDSIGTLATTKYTLTGVKGWVEIQFVKSGLFSIISTGTIS